MSIKISVKPIEKIQDSYAYNSNQPMCNQSHFDVSALMVGDNGTRSTLYRDMLEVALR